jgi:hypothetical protein
MISEAILSMSEAIYEQAEKKTSPAPPAYGNELVMRCANKEG